MGRFTPWYKTPFWRRKRKLQLLHHPLCKACLQRGIPTIATVADHVQPHRGDFNKFLLGELQSLCASCHSSRKAMIEARGYSFDVGDDGWPTDDNHPANKHR